MKNWVILVWMVISLLQMVVMFIERMYLAGVVWILAFLVFGGEGIINYVSKSNQVVFDKLNATEDKSGN